MSQQHMMFQSSEQPEQGPPASGAEGSLEQDMAPPSSFSEDELPYWDGQKLQPPPSTVPAWQLVLLVIAAITVISLLISSLSFVIGLILALLSLVLAALVVARWGFRRVITLPMQHFPVEGMPTLIIRNPAGSVSIRSGAADRVDVLATKHLSGLFGGQDTVAIEFAREGDVISVSSARSYQKLLSPTTLASVSLDISVPPHCQVEVEGNAGTIYVMGVSGRMALKTNAGTITLQQVTLKDQSSVVTDAGTLCVQQASLEGEVRLHTNAGTVSFAGNLAPTGSYQFSTNAGTIDVVLPPETSFALQASSQLGSVTNEFGLPVVGSPPRARLLLHTNLGTVTVRRGQAGS